MGIFDRCAVCSCVLKIHSESGVKQQAYALGKVGSTSRIARVKVLVCTPKGFLQVQRVGGLTLPALGASSVGAGCPRMPMQIWHGQPTGRQHSLHLQLVHLQAVLLPSQLQCPHQLQQGHPGWGGRRPRRTSAVGRPCPDLPRMGRGETEAQKRQNKGRRASRQESQGQRYF